MTGRGGLAQLLARGLRHLPNAQGETKNLPPPARLLVEFEGLARYGSSIEMFLFEVCSMVTVQSESEETRLDTCTM